MVYRLNPKKKQQNTKKKPKENSNEMAYFQMSPVTMHLIKASKSLSLQVHEL